MPAFRPISLLLVERLTVTAPHLNLTIAADSKNVSLAGAVIRTFCESVRLPDPDSVRIEIALVEAVNNTIAHGCRDRPDARIGLRAWIETGFLIIEVRDPGEPLAAAPPGAEMPDPLQESGRGWPLIRACVDRVDYRSEGGVNFLTLIKRLPTGENGTG